jgi:AraC family transcriptional regulator, dual regulator of chb operon
MEEKLFLRSEEIIDQETEIHYAFHRSLKTITSRHSHDFYELFFISRGKAVHKVNGRKEVIEEGTLVFMRPEDIHSYEKYNNEAFELINLAFTEATLQKLFTYLGEGFNPDRLLKTEYPPEIMLPDFEKELLLTRFNRLNTLSRKNKERIKTEFRIIIAEIFSRYFDDNKKEEQEGIPRWIIKIREEMEKKENFTKGISRMYEISGKSAEHLSRVFKKYFNETPTEFIQHIRLNYAANMLTNSDEDITSISMDSGFENLSHFYHLFKKHFNTSPKEFRTKHQKLIIPG